MKTAVLTIAFNDRDNLRACVKNWAGVTDRHLVLVSEVPWHGPQYPRDDSFEVARDLGAEAVLGRWQSEAEQRNWGLARLLDYDYVFIVDSDEMYTKEDQHKMLKQLEESPMIYIGCATDTEVYWKTPEYALDPTDVNRMIIVVDPKAVMFSKYRSVMFLNGNNNPNEYLTPIVATNHHMSYVRTDEQIRQKLTSYEHASSVKLDEWYNTVWKAWKPGDKMLVRPRGKEQSIARYKPAPQEILDLYKA